MQLQYEFGTILSVVVEATPHRLGSTGLLRSFRLPDHPEGPAATFVVLCSFDKPFSWAPGKQITPKFGPKAYENRFCFGLLAAPGFVANIGFTVTVSLQGYTAFKSVDSRAFLGALTLSIWH